MNNLKQYSQYLNGVTEDKKTTYILAGTLFLMSILLGYWIGLRIW